MLGDPALIRNNYWLGNDPPIKDKKVKETKEEYLLKLICTQTFAK